MRKKKILSASVLLTMMVPVHAMAASFTDVGTKFADKLDVLIGYGIVQDSETFEPTRMVNRAEAVKMILSTRGVEKGTGDQQVFKDSDANAWYAPYINAALDIDVLKGYPDATIRPGNGVNKAEFFTMLYRMHRAYFSVPLTTTLGATYTDVTKDDWFFDPVSWALDSFYTKNTTTFDPNHDLTREDVASIMYEYTSHFSKVLKEKGFGVIEAAPYFPPETNAEARNTNAMYDAENKARIMSEVGETSMPYYPNKVYRSQVKYEYTGLPLTDLDSTALVYKVIPEDAGQKISSDALLGVIPNAIKSMVSGLNSGNVLVESISFLTDPANEYRYYLDLAYGSFSISENHTLGGGYEKAYDTLTQEPNSLQLTSTARDFLQKLGISLDGYGKGEVNLEWKANEDDYIPPYHSVVFPKMVDGLPVYSEWGYPEQAIYASIFAPEMRVTSINGNVDRKKVASTYASKDWLGVLEDALNGGVTSPYVPYNPVEPMYINTKELPMPTVDPMGNDIEEDTVLIRPDMPQIPEDIEYVDQTVTVTLSRAEQVMMMVKSYDEGNYYTPREYYVPGVIFRGMARIETPGEETITDNNVRVMVPLIKENMFSKPGTQMYAKG